MKGQSPNSPAAHLTPTPICPAMWLLEGNQRQWTLAETGSIGQTTPGPSKESRGKWPPGLSGTLWDWGSSACEGKQHLFSGFTGPT